MPYDLFDWVVSFKKFPRFFVAYAVVFIIAFCAHFCVACLFMPLGMPFTTVWVGAIGTGIGCGLINAISLVCID